MDADLFQHLLKENDAVYVAVGAQESLRLGIPGEEAEGVLDRLSFLSALRRGLPTGLGSRVAVIGGGNAAMDCARAAKRLAGPHGEVTLVYRRSRREMPADREEIEAALQEGVRLAECLAPEEGLAQDGHVRGLRCRRMELIPIQTEAAPAPCLPERKQSLMRIRSSYLWASGSGPTSCPKISF
ncbi:MAG: FAD-dependent oxidoreductase [Bilophila sp.]